MKINVKLPMAVPLSKDADVYRLVEIEVDAEIPELSAAEAPVACSWELPRTSRANGIRQNPIIHRQIGGQLHYQIDHTADAAASVWLQSKRWRRDALEWAFSAVSLIGRFEGGALEKERVKIERSMRRTGRGVPTNVLETGISKKTSGLDAARMEIGRTKAAEIIGSWAVVDGLLTCPTTEPVFVVSVERGQAELTPMIGKASYSWNTEADLLPALDLDGKAGALKSFCFNMGERTVIDDFCEAIGRPLVDHTNVELADPGAFKAPVAEADILRHTGLAAQFARWEASRKDGEWRQDVPQDYRLAIYALDEAAHTENSAQCAEPLAQVIETARRLGHGHGAGYEWIDFAAMALDRWESRPVPVPALRPGM